MKKMRFFTIDVLRGEVGLRSAACAGNDLAIRAVSQNLPSGQPNSSYSEKLTQMLRDKIQLLLHK